MLSAPPRLHNTTCRLLQLYVGVKGGPGDVGPQYENLKSYKQA